jgi:LPXTG-motif cell wall-anchored protein
VLTGAVATAADITLPAGMLIGDQDGIRVSPTGEYFIEVEGLEPGDVITKKLAILNTEPYSYKLSMLAESIEETGPVTLLDEVHCTLKLDGRILYDGRVRGDEGIDMRRQALELTTIPSGGQKTLEIVMTVSPDLEYYWTTSEAIFAWHFNAVQAQDAGSPKTGEIVSRVLNVTFLVLLLTMGVLLLIRRQRNEKMQNGGFNV